jgi:hypothetical protein
MAAGKSIAKGRSDQTNGSCDLTIYCRLSLRFMVARVSHLAGVER